MVQTPSFMNHTNTQCPQVLGDPGVDADDSKLMIPTVRGEMNLRARVLNCQTTQAMKMDTEKLNVLTYNVKTLRTEERLVELENALDHINWDIIGLAEVRREGENTLERNQNIFYHYGNGSQYGVGFLVAKRWKSNIKEFIGYSDRIAVLKFYIDSKTALTLVQVYAPTSAHPDEEVEEFYDMLNKACDDNKGTWTIVIGDFNAKVGIKQDQDNDTVLGPYGLGIRNPRGERLLNFAFGQGLSLSNSFYSKKPQRRWTWFSPDKITKNEIDYCLSSSKQIVKNIEVLNRLKFSSDHRPLRCTLKFNFKIHRILMIKQTIRKLNKNTLIGNKDQFCLDLKNSFDLLDNKNCEDVETQYSNILETIKLASRKIKANPNKTNKISNQSKILIEERQKLTIYTPEYKIKDKEVKRCIRRDIRNYNIELVKVALDKNQSLKIAMRGTKTGKSSITGIKDINGVKQGDKSKILDVCTSFYKKLYSNTNIDLNNTIDTYSCADDIPPITGLEVHRALISMKYGKSPGMDEVTTETLKVGEPVLLPHLTNLFNSILKTSALPKNFCHSNIILLHKKGDKTDIGNYRPISLISHIYKIFIKVIEKRISEQLDRHQPTEQAGFRRGLSTTDHLHSINQLIEKYTEYKLPLYLAFVDYSKAFDSLNHSAIFEALRNQEIPTTYIQLLQKIYHHSTASIKIDLIGPSFHIERGVKQGDPLSPKLFTATLEEVFKKLSPNWSKRGIMVGERRLTNLRFADDIVLFSSSAAELGTMLNDLNTASLEVGLSMNMSKTKLMTNTTQHRLEVSGGEIAYVSEYLYLGQIVSFQSRQDAEVTRRTENAWKGYWAMKSLMKGNLPLTLKRKLMDACILPILTYGAQTWSLTDLQKSKLGVCQRAMERSILGVKLTDRIRNSDLRSKTQIVDVGHQVGRLKWDWAGHICRMSDELWAKSTTEWIPKDRKRPRGRPRRRWKDELDSHMKDWTTQAQNRVEWREGREAFALQWDSTGSK